MSMLSAGVSWLSSQLRDAAGVAVTIKRKTQSTAGVTAVMDNANYEFEGGAGAITRVRIRDWWIAKAAYQIGGSVVEPATGDKIVTAAGEEWEVTPLLGTSKGDVDAFSDWDDIQWILHTKRVKA